MIGNERRTPELDTATIRRIAVESDSDPRSVVKVLRGDRVRGMVGHRIREVLSRRGLLAPDVRTTEAA